MAPIRENLGERAGQNVFSQSRGRFFFIFGLLSKNTN